MTRSEQFVGVEGYEGNVGQFPVSSSQRLVTARGGDGSLPWPTNRLSPDPQTSCNTPPQTFPFVDPPTGTGIRSSAWMQRVWTQDPGCHFHIFKS